MEAKNILRAIWVYALPLGLLVLLNACSADEPAEEQARAECKAMLRADLARAIADAAIADESEVSHTLMPIDPEDPRQEWITLAFFFT